VKDAPAVPADEKIRIVFEGLRSDESIGR